LNFNGFGETNKILKEITSKRPQKDFEETSKKFFEETTKKLQSNFKVTSSFFKVTWQFL
jgi:hypothetical protein